MDFRILGLLEVRDGDRTVGLGGNKQRALLAILRLYRKEVVSADRLIDDLWGERLPPATLKALQAHISRLRKALDDHGTARSMTTAIRGQQPGHLVSKRERNRLLEVAAPDHRCVTVTPGEVGQRLGDSL
jgi:hypothetical protein